MAELLLYNKACRALYLAKNTDEVKDLRDKAEAMRAYAHQAKNRQLEIDATEIRIRAERRLGELIKAQKETVGLATGTRGQLVSRGVIGGTKTEPPIKPPTLADIGIDKKLSSHAQKVADIPEEEFEVIVDDWRNTLQEANERVTTNILAAADKVHNHRAQGTGENEWYTPVRYIEMARKVMGEINLDPASSEIANAVVCADAFYTKEDDGLAKPWSGNVWLNPPYAQPHIADFANKAIAESNNLNQAIILTHNYTDTAWFQVLAKACDSICFTKGRIAFESPEGKRAAPTQGQAFFYIGPKVHSFKNIFQEIGFIVRK